MKCVFFTIFLAVALMQVNSLRTSASTDSDRNSSAMPSNPLAMPSFTEQTPAAIQTLDLASLISSVTKLCPLAIDKTLPHWDALRKILPANSPIGSMIRGMQFLLENQQMLKMFDSTLAAIKSYPTGSNGRDIPDDDVLLKTATGLPHRKEKDESVDDHSSKKPSGETSSNADKNSSASGLPKSVNVKSNSAIGPAAKKDKRKQLLLQNKEALLQNRDTSDIEFISESEASRTNKSGNRGYLVHYGSDNNIWRTKNTDLIINMVYNHDFSNLQDDDDGYTEYKSADGTVSFTQYADRTYKTRVHLRDN